MEPLELAKKLAVILDEKKGIDIHILKISDITTIADFFVICTGTSNTHIKTLTDAAEVCMEAEGEPVIHREGYRSGTWVLLDFGSVVLHVFTSDTRKFYDLERLWSDAEPISLN